MDEGAGASHHWWGSGDRAGLEELVGSARYPQALARGAAAFGFIGAAGMLGSLAFVRHPDEGLRLGPVIALLVAGLAAAAFVWSFGPRWSVARLTALAHVFAAMISVGAWLAGPRHQEVAAAIAATAGPMFFFLPPRKAVLATGSSLAVYAACLAFSDGYPDPATRWCIVASGCAASAAVMTWISDRLRVLAVAERRAAAEVARLNAVLSDRVDDLGTFLSPHVAAAVRDTGDRAVLEPHRRQVAVLFVDLRGFTSFTAGAEPEDVVEVLGQFYATVGEVAQRRDASIGSFAGDGVMAYLGDPLPLDDAAGDAVAMAMELRIALEDLRNRWCGSGYRLGYGIGIAYGYVTLGVVGYEGRRDYTALGTVVNLAARLCGEAADGEIVLDARTKLAVDGQVDTEARAVVAKGFTEPVSAHVIPSATSRDPSTT